VCYIFWRFPPTLSFLELRFIFLFYYFHVHAAAAGALEPMSETCVVRVVCPLTDEMTPHTLPKEKKSFLIFLFGALNIMAHPLSPEGVFLFSFLEFLRQHGGASTVKGPFSFDREFIYL
jgi:hypothetical protein